MTLATAPGKLILCGEHAVVYGRPAIALPLSGVRARASVDPGPPGSGIRLHAPALGRSWSLAEAPDDPFSELVAALVARCSPACAPDFEVVITSDIPIASGMGSGAAIATALVRAVAGHLGAELSAAEISALVYGSERRFHGTPSGIDNTVVAFERAVWFVRTKNRERENSEPENRGRENSEPENRGRENSEPENRGRENRGRENRGRENQERENREPGEQGGSGFSLLGSAMVEPVAIGAPLTLLIGDSGVRSETRLPVGEVRRRWAAEPARYEALFDAVGAVVARVRAALASGDRAELGRLLDENQALLQEIGVSSPELDRLVAAARGAGALGAKLSGAGWGGVMIALVDDERREAVRAALLEAGAARVLETVVA